MCWGQAVWVRVEKWARDSAVGSSIRSGPGHEGRVGEAWERGKRGGSRVWEEGRAQVKEGRDGGTDLCSQCSHNSPRYFGRIPCMETKGWNMCPMLGRKELKGHWARSLLGGSATCLDMLRSYVQRFKTLSRRLPGRGLRGNLGVTAQERSLSPSLKWIVLEKQLLLKGAQGGEIERVSSCPLCWHWLS